MFTIFTDGATSNNGYDNCIGGSAWLIVKDDEIVAQSAIQIKPATNNICEMTAIIEALNYFEEHYPNVAATIYSDSAYCINCYKQKWYRSWENNGWMTSKKTPVLNQDLWKQLIYFFENPNFDFQKVKGHAGVKWNEYVDKLAVEAKSR